MPHRQASLLPELLFAQRKEPRQIALHDRALLATAFWLAAVASTSAADEPSARDAEFFENRVRPVLVAHCHECHGAEEQSGGLRLDSRGAALAGGDQGAALVAGEPGQSLLIKAISYNDEGLQMPPERKLTAAQIADLAEWVKRGAPWPGDSGFTPVKPQGEMVFSDEQRAHWAFQPLKKPPVPQPKNASWAKTDIDRFILARLEAAGLQPAPPADTATLLRRLSFDLTGLPPSAEEVAAFDRDKFDAQLATLLASAHYGERYARHWLDVARYADSNGSEVDHAMANAWRYRDYVVGALNDDLPYDQFVREQIAGDLLRDAPASALAATGFLMLGPKAVAELDKEKLLADVVDEQVDTLSRAVMGLTVGCARCHDHKFDPIGDEDYYALAGIFTSTRSLDTRKRVATWTERPLGPPEDAARRESLLNEIAALQKKRGAVGSGVAKRPGKLAADAAFLLIEAEDFHSGTVRVESDNLGRGIGVVRTRMEYPDHIEYEFEVATAGEYQLELRYAAKESRPTQLSINGNLEEMEAASEVTGDWTPAAQRWFVEGRYQFQAGKNTLAFHRDGPVPLFDKLLIGRVSAEPHSRRVPAAPAKPQVDAAATDAQKRKLDAAIAAAQQELESVPTVMAPYEGMVADAPILVRGNPTTPGAVVPRGFPRIIAGIEFSKPAAAQSGRLELAHWITQPRHPLTARVIVNRVWLWHFGEGLVRSPDNFGLRGEQPSHPELLDWLAVWFVENGWSLKKLHTLICTSAVYQQSSTPPAKGSKSQLADPENHLLSHFPRRRLDAESLRDAMLATSGKLDRSLGGSLMTVLNRTYANGGNAPPDIVEQMHYDSPRRSLYLPIIRNALYDFFAVFDYPDPGMLTGQRSRTTVAPQALFLMNSPLVRAQAAAFAERVQAAGDDDAARLNSAYSLAFARPPTAGETAAALAFLDRDEVELRRQGDKTPRAKAWTRLCHALLASNEFLYLR